MRGPSAAMVAAWALLAACSSPAPEADPAPAPSRTLPSPAPPAASPRPGPSVMVVHRSRRVDRLRPARWDAVRDGASDWRLVDSVARVARDPRSVAFVPLHEVRPWVRVVARGDEDPLAGTTSVRVVGDIMLDRGVAAVSPPDDPVWALRPIRRLLASPDLTIGNLEMALSENGSPQQPNDDSFAGPPQVLEGLAELGIDAVSLANNHTGDYGPVALRETLAAVRRSEVAGFGAGRTLDEARRGVVLDAAGLRVGLIGFNAIGETPAATPGSAGALSVTMPPRTGPLDRAQLATVLGSVRALARRADVVVVVPHWGGNYTHEVDPAQTYVARQLARAGADLVVGGHPHWVQGLERVGDGVVMHSVGNLVFDMDSMRQTMEGVALTGRFAGDRLVAVELTPYELDASFRPHLVPGAGVLADVRASSRGAFSAG